jgi:hypothetical protein
MIIVQSAQILYDIERTIRCTCSTVARTPLGDSQIVNSIDLLESRFLPQDNWTDDDLRVAVAVFLGVPSSDVAIAHSGVP